jgi:hypothetical protein
MSENFIPLSSQLGVSGTSYRLQLGKVGDKWATRILKGKDVVASTTLEELNGNMVVGFVMRETAIPNLNPYSIMKTVQFLTREAKSNEENMKKKGIPAPQGEPTPASPPKPSEATSAPVDKEMMSDEDVRASYRVVAKPQASSESVSESSSASGDVKRAAPKSVSSTGRKLKPIPGAGSSPKESSTPKSQAKSATKTETRVQSSSKVSEKRIGKIEDQLAKMTTILEKIDEKLGKIEEKLAK